MDESSADGASQPLLRKKPAKPLFPLYVVTFMQALAFTVAKMPALSLRFQEFAAAEGWEASAVATAHGRMAALRNLLELIAMPVLAGWSDRVGRRRIMLLGSLALCVECALLASVRSLWALVLAHVAFGLFADSNGTLEGSCIADATPPGSQRVIAFGKLFTVVGAAVIVGPAVGGELAAWGGTVPLMVGCGVACCAFLFLSTSVPEYLPKSERSQRTAANSGLGRMLLEFMQLLSQSPGLRWHVAATMLAQMALGSFGAVQPLWASQALGWGGRDLGRFISLAGLTMVVAHGVLLPMLLKVMQGREPALAQLCLLIQACRLTFYGLAPNGSWVYLVLIVTTGGMCHTPVLRSLCSRSAGQHQQGLLSGGTAAVGTAAQVLGSLLGSSVFSATLRHGLPLSLAHYVSACFFILAAACVSQGIAVEAKQKAASEEKGLSSPALGA